MLYGTATAVYLDAKILHQPSFIKKCTTTIYNRDSRSCVTNVLLVAQRLVLHAQQWTPKQLEQRVSDGDDQAASAELVVEKESAAATADGGGDADTVDKPAALLPPEIWHFILSFIFREDLPNTQNPME